MNKLIIPPAANWYETNILACAPDNTVLYGSRGDIVIITPSENDNLDNVEIISKAHISKIIAININPNWRLRYKNAVSVSDDKTIKTWDMEAYVQTACHNKHLLENTNFKVIGAVYVGDNCVMSASESGRVIIWNTLTNNIDTLDFLKHGKPIFTCFSLCPHNISLVAFGLRTGLIILASLKDNGKIIYKLRSHDSSILSFSWCPIPTNVLQRPQTNSVTELAVNEKIIETKNSLNSDEAVLSDTSVKEKIKEIEPIFSQLSIEDIKLSKEETNQINDFIPTGQGSSELNNSTSINKETVDENDVNKSESQYEANESNNVLSVSIKKEILDDETVKELVEITETTKQLKQEIQNENADVNIQSINKEFLLASTSIRNSNIVIWRAGTDGRIQTSFPIKKKKNYNKSSTNKMWNILCWVAPDILLYSGNDAELYMCNFNSVDHPRLIHNDHRQVLFSIKTSAIYLKEKNNDQNLTVWTLGKDRYIFNVDIKSHDMLRCYPTLGSNPTYFCGSVLDPNRLALIAGENAIHLWDLSQATNGQIIIVPYYQKNFFSITTLAWNPDNDMLLAWGTTEGRVGVFDASNKTSKIMTQYFTSKIHKIEWGPLPSNGIEKGLYVVGDGQLAIFNPMKPNSDPETITVPQGPVYTIAWKPDYSTLLIAPKSDNLLRYSPDLQLITYYYVPQRIQSIIWHPDATVNDVISSKYCQMFVTLNKSVQIIVYDLAIECECFDDRIVANFKNRDTVINSIAWSPHCGNHLVFVDQDGVAQIFDIDLKLVISTYINSFCDPFHPVYWSPIDSDYIIGGIQGNKIIIWKISEHGPLTETEIVEQRTQRLSTLAKAVNNNFIKEKEKTKRKQQITNQTASSSIKSIIPIFCTGNADRRIEDIRHMIIWKSGAKSIEEIHNKITENIDILDIFDPDLQLEHVFNLNIQCLKREGNYQGSTLLSLFKGNLNETIKDAIEHKKLNPTIISLCPMVSPTLWKTACETYADQLMEQPDANPFEIVTFLLTCHKVEDAVKLLCEKNLFKEAVVLAKTRFGGKSDIFKSVLEKWSQVLVNCGNYEQAALCFIALEKYENAASLLLKRLDIEQLELAVDLAKLSKNLELYKVALLKYVSFKLPKNQENQTELLEVEQQLQQQLDSVFTLKLEDGRENQNDTNDPEEATREEI